MQPSAKVAPTHHDEPPPWEESPVAQSVAASQSASAEAVADVATPVSASNAVSTAQRAANGAATERIVDSGNDYAQCRAEPNSPQAHWNHVVAQLHRAGALQALAGQLAVQAECVAFDAATVHLRIEQQGLMGESIQDKLREAFAAQSPALDAPWGGKLDTAPLKWRVEQGAVRQSYRLEQEAVQQARQAKAEQLFHALPTVQFLQQQCGAKVLPDSVTPIDC